jgi:hypothetical protein
MLAGYQPKLLLALLGGQWCLSRGRTHPTHVLKPRAFYASGHGLTGHPSKIQAPWPGRPSAGYLVTEKVEQFKPWTEPFIKFACGDGALRPTIS